MTEFLGIQVEIFAGVIIPVTTGMTIITWKVIRYIINKEICFKLLKAKVNTLSESDNASDGTHKNLHDKYNEVSNRLSKVEGKLDLICKHFKISLE